MKNFINSNASSFSDAVAIAQAARSRGQVIAFSGGGSDLLQQLKDGVVKPDLVINLRSVAGSDQVESLAEGVSIGGLITLDTLASNELINSQYIVLAEAARSVATPQIRNVGTLAGNITQRPWCWYYRNGFACFKAGGNQCFSVAGENQFNAIFGGGPSFIVHASDLAPALVALQASFNTLGPGGARRLSAEEFFISPAQDPAHENALGAEELLSGVSLPIASPGMRSAYHKVMDRKAWTHAVVSAALVLDMRDTLCVSARLVLGGVAPIPWRLPEVERLLAGQTLNADLAREAGAVAIANARPLAKNAYKLPLTSAVVERTIMSLVKV
jgi:xanthine dehydrogenase YagS FAD-binding subunit